MNNISAKIDKAKMYDYLVKLCWFTLIFCWVLKLLGCNDFVVPEYTYNISIHIRRTINGFLFCTNGLLLTVALIKRKLTFKESLLVLSFEIPLFLLSLINELMPLVFVLETICYFIIGCKFIKDKKKNILLEAITINLLFIIYQIITLFYKNINVKIQVDNFIVDKILMIDFYIMILLTILREIKKGEYLHVRIFQNIIHLGRWCKFMVVLPRNKRSKENISKNQINVQKGIENEVGYKIFAVMLAVFQFTFVGTLCYFINHTIWEYIIIFISFVFMRICFGKSYHSKTIIACTTLACIIYVSMTKLSLPPHISMLFNVLLGTTIAYMMYVMYYFIKYTNSQGITITRGMNKELLLEACSVVQLNETELNIMIDFYCNKMSLVKMARKYGYSQDNISKLKKKILDKIRV